jgi:hypothetical protein
MKWTPEKIAELRALAPTGLGSERIAARFGVRVRAVRDKAYALKIAIARHSDFDGVLLAETPPDILRRRWAPLIGPMKERLRAEVEAIL